MSTESDPTGRSPHEPGAKLDAGKIRAWLCIGSFAHALAEVAAVTTYGAQKYTPNGWKSVPDATERYMDAAMRHLLAHGRGELVDADTGLAHLAHAAWNLLAVMELGKKAAPVMDVFENKFDLRPGAIVYKTGRP